MKVTDEALLRSGFTPSDLQKIKNNVESYGGTLGEAIQDSYLDLFRFHGNVSLGNYFK